MMAPPAAEFCPVTDCSGKSDSGCAHGYCPSHCYLLVHVH